MAKTTEDFVCFLKLDTAISLQNLMLAQQVHAETIAKEKGMTTLLDSCNKLQPFLNALSDYINKNLK